MDIVGGGGSENDNRMFSNESEVLEVSGWVKVTEIRKCPLFLFFSRGIVSIRRRLVQLLYASL